jgi:two-component system, cell cycle response regulator DivK
MDAVLLVERHADTAEMYSVGLQLAGYHPIVVAQPDAVIGETGRQHARAIVTEVEIAAANDWRFMHALRADPATKGTPVIALLTRPDPNLELILTSFGCAALLLKPCLPETLVATLRRVLHPSQHGAAAQPFNGGIAGSRAP